MNHFFLNNLAPIVQFFLGFYSLLFFEQVLTCSPFKTKEKNISEGLLSFFDQYQLYLYSRDININDIRKRFDRWEPFYKTLQDVATLLFLYCLSVLIFLGLENEYVHSDEFCARFCIASLLVDFYVIISLIFFRNKRMLIYRAIFVYFILCLFCFLCPSQSFISRFFFSGFGMQFNSSYATYCTLFTSLSGFIGLCVRLLYLDAFFFFSQRKLKKASGYVSYLTSTSLLTPDPARKVLEDLFVKGEHKRNLKEMLKSHIRYLRKNHREISVENLFFTGNEDFVAEEIRRVFLILTGVFLKKKVRVIKLVFYRKIRELLKKSGNGRRRR